MLRRTPAFLQHRTVCLNNKLRCNFSLCPPLQQKQRHGHVSSLLLNHWNFVGLFIGFCLVSKFKWTAIYQQKPCGNCQQIDQTRYHRLEGWREIFFSPVQSPTWTWSTISIYSFIWHLFSYLFIIFRFLDFFNLSMFDHLLKSVFFLNCIFCVWCAFKLFVPLVFAPILYVRLQAFVKYL